MGKTLRVDSLIMYYFIFAVLFFFSAIEMSSYKKSVLWFNIVYVLMTLMVMFRYGQLTDYFNYEYLYDNPDSMGEWRDPLYFLMERSCIALGLGYNGFVFIVGGLTMALAYPFFSRYCEQSAAALLVFYCYVFLILPMSAMRQGICLGMLLWSYSLLIEGKKLWFYIIMLIGSLIHFSMLAVALIGLFHRKDWFNRGFAKWIVFGLTIFALVTPDLTQYIPDVLGDRSLGEYEDSRLVQMSIRVLLIIPVLFIKPEYGTHGYYAKAICIIGYCLYCCLAFSSLIAGRFEFFFRVFYCLFIAQVLFNMGKIYLDHFLLACILMIHVVLFFKNMNAAIDQGDYYEDKVTMYNFPYISIFEEKELENYKFTSGY